MKPVDLVDQELSTIEFREPIIITNGVLIELDRFARLRDHCDVVSYDKSTRETLIPEKLNDIQHLLNIYARRFLTATYFSATQQDGFIRGSSISAEFSYRKAARAARILVNLQHKPITHWMYRGMSTYVSAAEQAEICEEPCSISYAYLNAARMGISLLHLRDFEFLMDFMGYHAPERLERSVVEIIECMNLNINGLVDPRLKRLSREVNGWAKSKGY